MNKIKKKKTKNEIVKLNKRTKKIVDNILSLRNSDYFNLLINGNSMYPCLKNGDIVKISTMNLNLIKQGDIIVYREFETHLTVHRVADIIKLSETYIRFVTKGDNNDYVDSYNVDLSNVLGKVVW